MQLSQIIVGGPGKVVDPNGTIYTAGDIVLKPVPVFRSVESSVNPEGDKVLVDLTWQITFEPKSIWDSSHRAVLAPSAFYNFATSGARLLGNVNRTVSIIGADGAGYDLTRAITTQMSSIYCGLNKPLWGECQMTAFIGNGKALTDADAFLVANSTAWSQTDYPTGHQEAMCTAAWGSVTGWSAVYAEEGFQLNHALALEPVKQGNVTVDMRIISYRATVGFKPQQPTSAQLLTALNPVIGSRRSTNAHNLVITGGGLSVTAHGVAIEDIPQVWSNRANRHGDLVMGTALSGPGTRLTLA